MNVRALKLYMQLQIVKTYRLNSIVYRRQFLKGQRSQNWRQFTEEVKSFEIQDKHLLAG